MPARHRSTTQHTEKVARYSPPFASYPRSKPSRGFRSRLPLFNPRRELARELLAFLKEDYLLPN